MINILESAYKAWSSGATLRQRRQRYKSYTYGDQWCDYVRDRNGHLVREERLLEECGAKPLTNNLIRQLVKSVVGRFRAQASERGDYSGPDIAELSKRNSLSELDSRLLEEFLISGCAIQRIVDERRWEGCGVWIDNVDLSRFFVNAFTDPRGRDIDLIGMLHDMTLPEIINRFAGGSKSRAEKLRHIYSSTDADTSFGVGLELGEAANPDDFFHTSDNKRFRVIEVWTFDCREAKGNVARMDFVWHCRYLAPDGTVLSEFDSPYRHRSHPFVVKFYPLTDGEGTPLSKTSSINNAI
ncbi:MAG: hypothetical protein J1F05_02480 [Muribaculaceae bacterium]|nr:hypothetical protein [Muribaculaceae bacterium]